MKMLFILLLSTMAVGLVMLFYSKRISKKYNETVGAAYVQQLVSLKGKKKKQRLYLLYQRSYILSLKIPFLKNYVLKIRKRISSIHSYDEITMRKETMRIAFWVLGTLGTAVIVVSLFAQDLTYFFLMVLGAIVVNGLLIDTFVHRLEDRLLNQLVELFSDIRHSYHQHGMVDEAIKEAAELSDREISLHARRIYEVIDDNPSETLEEYYQVAPNRFLKLFAGISYLVKEFGDKMLPNGSMYLGALNRLKNDVLLEILKRRKLSYLLRNLGILTIAPTFFIPAIESWAKTTFPAMDSFYSSKFGFLIKLLILVIIMVSYILIRKLQDNEEINSTSPSKHRIIKRLYSYKIIKRIVDSFVPGSHTKEYFKYKKLLKDTNSSLTVEWFQLKRIAYCFLFFVASIGVFIYLHNMSINQMMNLSPVKVSFFGSVDSSSISSKGEDYTKFDVTIIKDLKGVRHNIEDRVYQSVVQEIGQIATPEEVQVAVNRISSKLISINNEYLKWWEVLISILVAFIAYQGPLWILYFQRRFREMEMKNEVDQMHSIISMLCEIERISVESVIEWMERFSKIFKPHLKKCLLNFESGPNQALEDLKIEAPFPAFVRTVERLQNSLERIPIKQAFDDLETDRNYYLEERKQEYERTIDVKAEWGRIIGFTPINAVILLYLVLPFLYVSILDMNTYFNQLNNLS